MAFTTEEQHALLIGLCETAWPVKPRHCLTEEAEFTPRREYHYYLIGRVLGAPVFFLLLSANFVIVAAFLKLVVWMVGG